MIQQGHETMKIISTPEARQGLTGLNVRYVLGVSLAAVVVAFGTIFIYFFR
jgi:hypothetical protein